nr:BsuPI-related putative proteinase inhibitor [Desulforamulus aquiferis]
MQAWRETSLYSKANRGIAVYINFGTEVFNQGTPIRIRLLKVNVTNATIVLRYPTGQRFELVVRRRPGNTEIWRYSRERFFTQAEALSPLGQTNTPSMNIPGISVMSKGCK